MLFLFHVFSSRYKWSRRVVHEFTIDLKDRASIRKNKIESFDCLYDAVAGSFKNLLVHALVISSNVSNQTTITSFEKKLAKYKI